MNTILQCLVTAAPFINVFLSGVSAQICTESLMKGQLSTAFGELARSMLDTHRKAAVSPTKLKEVGCVGRALLVRGEDLASLEKRPSRSRQTATGRQPLGAEVLRQKPARQPGVPEVLPLRALRGPRRRRAPRCRAAASARAAATRAGRRRAVAAAAAAAAAADAARRARSARGARG
jgi:hypothetical protein